MKKHVALISLATVFALSAAVAQTNVKLALDSSDVLLSAVKSGSKVGFSDFVYLPGYGISTAGTKIGEYPKEQAAIFAQIKGLTAALASTVKGVDANEYVSFNVLFINFSADDVNVTYREKFADLGKPDKWEVWVDGVLQK